MTNHEVAAPDEKQPDEDREGFMIPELTAQQKAALSPKARLFLALVSSPSLHPTDKFNEYLMLETGLDEATLREINRAAKHDGEVEYESIVMTKSTIMPNAISSLLNEIDRVKRDSGDPETYFELLDDRGLLDS